MTTKIETVDIAPFLILIAELAATEEGRDSVMFMANSVASSDDLLAWVSYFNLPVGGWTEGTEPPAVGLLATNDAMAISDNGVMFAGLASAVPVAHASGGRAARATRAVMQRAFRGAHAALEEVGLQPEEFAGYLRIVRASHKQMTREVTRMLRDPQYLKLQMQLAKTKSQAAMREAMRDQPSDRITVREMAGIVAFLSAANATGTLHLEFSKVVSKLATAFVASASNRHGARFHLMMMAELHLLSLVPIGGADVARVADSEAERTIPFYDRPEDRRNDKILSSMTRNVDLITTSGSGTETWWELKSLQDGSESSSAFSTWRMHGSSIARSGEPDNRSRGGYHRQFVGDRVGYLLGADSNLNDEQRAGKPTEVRWTFQKFTTQNHERSLDPAGVEQVRVKLCASPEASSGSIRGSFGKSPTRVRKECGPLRSSSVFGDLLNVGERITVNLRGAGDRLVGYLDSQDFTPVLETAVP